MTRVVLSECIKWATQRKVFGKPLIDQPVIQQKIAEMITHIEADHSWIEAITYQMQNMTYEQMSEHLAGPIALLKYKSTRTGLLVADHAVQIVGGRAITKGGMGRLVNTFYTWVKFPAVYGGSEEIMASLGIKQMMKKMPTNEKL
jgi:alkylation response protein AidB-like acyl-CoA dehydrogenase